MSEHATVELLKKIAVRGVDLLEFVDGKITPKDSFWKIVD